MSRHDISDQVLKMMVGIRLESGIDVSKIRCLVEKFASEQPNERHPVGTVGFLWVEDIPSDRRPEFLSAMAVLSPHSAESNTGVMVKRAISANAIWG